ncbi:MAG: hypothetical protein AAFV93_11300 [Chloroflexota bacterium]
MAIQKQFISNPLTDTLTSAPARIMTQARASQYIVVVLSEKSDERILPQAMRRARANKAELIIIYRCDTQQTALGLAYEKQQVMSIRNKCQAQYEHVSVYLHQGKSASHAIEEVTHGLQGVTVLMPKAKRTWLSPFGGTSVANMIRRQVDVLVEEITL